jgi:predicted metal-binding membrane protein
LTSAWALLEAALRRERLVALIGVLMVVAGSWAWLLLGAGTGMTPTDMTRMAGMDGWLMEPAQWSIGYALLMFSMWWVMMIAMMVPSAAPMLLLFARVNGQSRSASSHASSTGLFAAGYLLVWGGFSAVAVALQWALETARLLSPMLETSTVLLGAGILIAAGLWQLSPMKGVCLRHCRTPLGFLIGHWRPGYSGVFRMGLAHGAWCLGCCWALMTLLFFGGVMNLYWIIGLAVFVLLEKTIPHGQWVGRAVGIVLVGWGVLLLY